MQLRLVALMHVLSALARIVFICFKCCRTDARVFCICVAHLHVLSSVSHRTSLQRESILITTDILPYLTNVRKSYPAERRADERLSDERRFDKLYTLLNSSRGFTNTDSQTLRNDVDAN